MFPEIAPFCATQAVSGWAWQGKCYLDRVFLPLLLGVVLACFLFFKPLCLTLVVKRLLQAKQILTKEEYRVAIFFLEWVGGNMYIWPLPVFFLKVYSSHTGDL